MNKKDTTKDKLKQFLRLAISTLLLPLIILYLVAEHYFEQRKTEALRYVILDALASLFGAWRLLFGFSYFDKSVELSRYNRKLTYGIPAKKLLGLSKEQMNWLLDNTHFYYGRVWKNGDALRNEYLVWITEMGRHSIKIFKNEVIMINHDTGWVLETDFKGLQENIDNRKFTEWD